MDRKTSRSPLAWAKNHRAFRLAAWVIPRLNRYCRLSFSQEAEDLTLQELGQWGKVTAGLYVDVGAHHPWRFSNTAIYYLRGWRGINIDPTPGVMELFQKMRPTDTNLELAISTDECERTFYIYNESALNGIDCDRSEELAGTGMKLMRSIPVNTVPLVKVLQQHIKELPRSNFLSVDAEGHDLEVLQSNDWERYPFAWVLTECEGRDVASTLKSNTYHYLCDLGYVLRAKTGRTAIFSRTGKP